jgi:hypothetical protein
LSRAEYFYTHPIHFAVRSGHLEVVHLLFDEGVDPEWNSFHDGSLIEMARDRGHEYIARILEQARGRRGRISPGPDHPIHQAAKRDDVERVREFLTPILRSWIAVTSWVARRFTGRSWVPPAPLSPCCSIAEPISMRSTALAADREADGVRGTCKPSTSRSLETILPLRPKAISSRRASCGTRSHVRLDDRCRARRS